MRVGLFTCLLVWLAWVAPGRAEEQQATFALIVGVNHSPSETLHDLKYADDDAARYFDLFRSLGARTYLLTQPDPNTRGLHPQAAAEALSPTGDQFDKLVGQIQADVKRARERGVRSVVYFVYAGHGEIVEGRGELTLRDRGLSSASLSMVVDQLGADRIHFILDACYSYTLALPRGAGGSRRELSGFSQVNTLNTLADHDHVGLLLSTSSAAESHEWEAFQAGVFSHEVRSGLYGAADADRNGQVSYKEIAAFVERANLKVPNERYRPRVYARPPGDSDLLLDIRSGLKKRLQVDGQQHGHYFLEDQRGIRLADFHNGPTQTVDLVLPVSAAKLFLRRANKPEEYTLPDDVQTVRLADLTPADPRSQVRGAAHEAFRLLFAQPFDTQAVTNFNYPPLPEAVDLMIVEEAPATIDALAWTTLAVGVSSVLVGASLTFTAQNARDGIDELDSQLSVNEVNQDIEKYNQFAVPLYIIGGCAVAAGLVMLLWPDSETAVGLGALPGGGAVSLGGRF